MKNGFEQAPASTSVEKPPMSFEVFRQRGSKAFQEFIETLPLRGDDTIKKFEQLLARAVKGVSLERVSVAVSEIMSIGSSAEVTVSLPTSAPSLPRIESAEDRFDLECRVAVVAVLVSGCFAPPTAEEREAVAFRNSVAKVDWQLPLTPGVPGSLESVSRKSWVSGDAALSGGKYGVAVQPEVAPDESHRAEMPDSPLKPEHAPSGYGMHQWKGYSEYNPVAVAWLAIKNVGNEQCTVEVTRLELSYKMPDGTAVLGSSSINAVYRLGDGTKGTEWGEDLGSLYKGSTFTLPPHTPDYVHPFGYPVQIPEDAEQVTVTFSAKITEGCIVMGGMDTYSDFGTPRTTDGYTQNGSPTDYIKEAVKIPPVGETVLPENPISYAIPHKQRDDNSEEEDDNGEEE